MHNISNNKFITFEGIDGCGKSIQSKLLHDYLCYHGYEVVLTREIGGTEVSEKLRNIIMQLDSLPMTELLMVMAARFEHMHKVIIPALVAGKWVICDRFIDSTIAYQGPVTKLSTSKILAFNDTLVSPLMPRVTFFIDVPPETAKERIESRGDNNKFDHKDETFHHNVRNNFMTLYRLFPNRITRIDSHLLSQSEVHSNVLRSLFPCHMNDNADK